MVLGLGPDPLQDLERGFVFDAGFGGGFGSPDGLGDFGTDVLGIWSF
jgi:hypothetical protein